MIEQEDEENPYAPPKVHEVRPVERPGLAWRDGQMLMVRKGAELPDRCLKCNASAEGYRFKRSLTWLSPYWAILILVCGPIPFAIIYLCLCARGKLTAGLCPVHRTSRRRAIAIGWLTVLLGVGSMIVAGFLSDARTIPSNVIPFVILSGIILVIVGLLVVAIGAQVLVPSRIDKHFIWLKKVSPAYLATFPDRTV